MKFKSPDTIPDHARKRPPSNLGPIRNIGSVVGKVVGWDRIIFSDDDISYTPGALHAVSRMLPGHKIAGMQCLVSPDSRDRLLGFADKDVVHHALDRILHIHSSPKVIGRPVAAGHISGNSIAANPQISGLVFPPEIYDEDLIGFYDMYVEGSAALAMDAAYYQVPYDPFADPKRAKWEVFGELIHDGLYLPFWKRMSVDLTDPRHWGDTIAQRTRKIETLLSGLDAPQKREYFTYMGILPERDLVQETKIRQSLLAALAMNESLSGIMGVDYLRAWHEDKITYRNCMSELVDRSSIPVALDWLGLSYLSNAAA